MKGGKVMRKGVVAVLAFVAALTFVSAVYAYLPAHSAGKYGLCDVKPGKAGKFHEETLSLRDQLVIKKLEVHREFARRHPDIEKIASIRKEIADIRAKIMKKADGSGLPEYRSRFRGCSWTRGKGIIDKSPTPTLM
jgi:hypothetical protein